MWFQLTAQLCSVSACNFFLRLMKEQIVVDTEQTCSLKYFLKSSVVFQRFPSE